MKTEIYTSRWDSGDLEVIGTIVDGRKQGPWMGWHHNGRICWREEGRDAEMHGVVRTWGENGDLHGVRLWIKGIPEDIPIGVLIPLEPIM